MELEKYYELFKGLLPYAEKIFPKEHPLSNNLDDIKQIFSMVESIGGIDNIANFLNLKTTSFAPNNKTQFTNNHNNLPAIDSLPKIKQLD